MTWLLVLFLVDPVAMPVTYPVESEQACRELAPVQAFRLQSQGRPVLMASCQRAPLASVTRPTGEIDR